MDHLLLSFLNSRFETPDPLETPLGAARWWASVQNAVSGLQVRPDGKPRFDSGMAEALRALRDAIWNVKRGNGSNLRFTGNPEADAVLFPIAYAAEALFRKGGDRLKDCALKTCGRYFLDQTKNGSRRWCSLRCMERARAPRRRTISR